MVRCRLLNLVNFRLHAFLFTLQMCNAKPSPWRKLPLGQPLWCRLFQRLMGQQEGHIPPRCTILKRRLVGFLAVREDCYNVFLFCEVVKDSGLRNLKGALGRSLIAKTTLIWDQLFTRCHFLCHSREGGSQSAVRARWFASSSQNSCSSQRQSVHVDLKPCRICSRERRVQTLFLGHCCP